MPASLGSEPRPSRRAGADPQALADWEARAFSVNRRHRAATSSTPVDDALPEEPWNHEAETKDALARIARS